MQAAAFLAMNISDNDDQREERLDCAHAKPNRFAERFVDEQITVVLDPDVAAVFHTSEDVNRVLRALIQTMPHPS
jgi:hypothetical protein